MITIALDAMSGDNGLSVAVPASLLAIEKHPELKIIMVGNLEALNKAMPNPPDRIVLHHASQVVAMDELPSQALRGKKDSSMRVAVNLVKDGTADAVVSPGNTGALMAISRFVLKTMDGIDRPVLCTALPSVTGPVWMLDLGANVDSSSEHLRQFAIMGNALVKVLTGSHPSIGLLNIGEEEIKGNESIKGASKLLRESSLDYRGFVEGNDIYQGKVQLVVCDGFIGNIALKTSEGMAKMVRHYLTHEFKKSWLRKIAGIISLPALKSFKSHLDPRVYNGATLLGLKGISVKSHGGTDAFGLSSAISVGYKEVSHDLLAQVQTEINISNQNKN